jgi:DNA invertase Pin-like site-specific DNA recombinase
MVMDVMELESGIHAILVCYTRRFFRNRSNAGAMKTVLRKSGVRVIAIYQETSDDPMGQFVEGIFELVDQYESDINAMRTAAAMRKNAELGFHNGSKAPYGFVAEAFEARPGQTKRRLVPNPEEKAPHNEVFRQYIARQGAKTAAREMNQRGYKYRDGKLWTKDLVLKVIEEIVVNGPNVQMVTRSEAVVRMMAAGTGTAAEAALERDPAVSPTFAVGWLRLLDSNRPEVLDSRGITDDLRTDDPTRVDANAREVVAFGPTDLEARTVEDALAGALARAAAAGRWDIVAQLARELEARR